jgi:hypothetical protein
VRLRRPAEVEVVLPPALAQARARIDAHRRRRAAGAGAPDGGDEEARPAGKPMDEGDQR